MTSQLELSLPCTADSIREMRAAVAELGRAAGLRAEKVEDVQLAVSEAVTNAVQHGGRGQGEVMVEARMVGDELRISVSDHGGGMRPRPDSPGLGLGLPIMAAVSDHLEVVTDGGGTTVNMIFVRD
jgi:serine/threonine-protein kinase RsbW